MDTVTDPDVDGTGSTPGSNPPVRRLDAWEADRLRSLADDHGTPLYVTDLGRIRENYARMRGAFPGAEIYYAAKANASRAVLRTLADAGAGVECASAGEVERARRAGVPTGRILYTAVNPPDEDLDLAVSTAARNADLTTTVGARDTIDRLVERDYAGRVCIRIHPGIGAGHHEKVATGADAKFGIPADRVIAAIEYAANAGLDVVGLHAHVGSGITDDDLDTHRTMVRRVADLARESPVPLEFVDVGGGFGVPYRPEDPPLDLATVADATREALGRLDATLAIEPGRYLVADAGVLLSRVNTVKSVESETIVGVDAGMTTLLRPALYDAYHDLRLLAPDAPSRSTVSATVTGPVCESADVFCAGRSLPAPRRDDLIAIGNAGAYGFEMTSHYNSRPRPATVVVDGERTAVDRRRETIDDVVRTEREVGWL